MAADRRTAPGRALDRRPDRAVLHSIQDHRLHAAFHLIALRGLRRGEAAGLRWCDIDLGGKTAIVTQQLQQYDGRLAICPPKTPHSARVIALDHTTVAALRRTTARDLNPRIKRATVVRQAADTFRNNAC